MELSPRVSFSTGSPVLPVQSGILGSFRKGVKTSFPLQTFLQVGGDPVFANIVQQIVYKVSEKTAREKNFFIEYLQRSMREGAPGSGNVHPKKELVMPSLICRKAL